MSNQYQNNKVQIEFQKSILNHQQGKLADAEKGYRSILSKHPGHFEVIHMLGVIHLQRGEFQVASEYILKSLDINPNNAGAQNNLGNALQSLGNSKDALGRYKKALEIQPNFFDASYNAGIAARSIKDYVQAIKFFDQASGINPKHGDSILNKAYLLRDLGNYKSAIESFSQLIELRPKEAQLYLVRANLFKILRNYTAANSDLNQALLLQENFPSAFVLRASIHFELGDYDLAKQDLDKAILLKPNYAEAYNNLGILHMNLKQFDEALIAFDVALSLDPDYKFLRGQHFFMKCFLCDWQNYNSLENQLLIKIRENKPVSTPFSIIPINSTAEDQLHCNKLYSSLSYHKQEPLWRGESYNHDKIRVAYLSSDFYEHATSYLMAGLFEEHDKQKFEIFGFALNKFKKSEMRDRLEKAFDNFIDVSALNDFQIAQIIRENEIDILLDLKGYTLNNRSGILSYRPAPVQVNYLGYPSTMGSDLLDYIIGDKTVVSPEMEKYFSEKVAYMSDSYQPNDRKRIIPNNIPNRVDLGLPEKGFVFCSFNNTYKITPEVFDVWMRLLLAVPDSVLWLLHSTDSTANNLKIEANKRGVSADRLVFAPYVSLSDHLARYQCADLFLDTIPCNAHTTASDSLWVGVPVVTCLGKTFAGRVAASLLKAVGLPELITHSLDEYESLAYKLASDTATLSELKEKLISQRNTCALFDIKKYAKNIEGIYDIMMERHNSKSSKSHIAISEPE